MLIIRVGAYFEIGTRTYLEEECRIIPVDLFCFNFSPLRLWYVSRRFMASGVLFIAFPAPDLYRINEN